MRTFKLTINEDELRALINHHASGHNYVNGFNVERSSRIHDLTKRLNKRVDDNNNDVDDNNDDVERKKATEVASIDGWG